MCSSHQCAGYVKDVSMEVKSAFFPPPTIVVPSLNIPPLKNYVYKFETERHVVKYYEEENRRRNAAVTEEAERRRIAMEADEATPSTSTQPAPTASPIDSAPSAAVGDRAPGAVPPPRPPIPMLKPEQLWSTPPMVAGGSQRESPAASSSASVGMSNGGTSFGTTATRPPNLHGFEEFEATTTLFDLMELKSLDDRKELEKLLM